jgi:hypothetical protein
MRIHFAKRTLINGLYESRRKASRVVGKLYEFANIGSAKGILCGDPALDESAPVIRK